MRHLRRFAGMVLLGSALVSETLAETAPAGTMRPEPRPSTLIAPLPQTRWDHRPDGPRWTAAAMAALQAHGTPLVQTLPADIGHWCPGYAGADAHGRSAFWVGLLSALARYESTYRQSAVGGGGRWYGLLQIMPATARGYGCRAQNGEALRDGGSNLSCAVRILARTVPRDGVIASDGAPWRGVAADWGPMRVAARRAEMAGWLRDQPWCQVQITRSPRPQPRPAVASMATD